MVKIDVNMQSIARTTNPRTEKTRGHLWSVRNEQMDYRKSSSETWLIVSIGVGVVTVDNRSSLPTLV